MSFLLNYIYMHYWIYIWKYAVIPKMFANWQKVTHQFQTLKYIFPA